MNPSKPCNLTLGHVSLVACRRSASTLTPRVVPVYHATDRISKRALTKKHQLTAGTIKEVWAIVLNQSEREERIALRDSCKTLRECALLSSLGLPPLRWLVHSLYYVQEYRDLSLKKFCFNARCPDEILVLDWRSRRDKEPFKAAGMPSSSSLPRRYKAMPFLRVSS